MANQIKPSDINKNLYEVLGNIKDKHSEKLFGNSGNSFPIPLDKKAFITSATTGLLAFASVIAAPTFAPALITFSVVSLIGSITLGAIHKIKEKIDINDTVKDFCKTSGLDINNYKNIYSSYGFDETLIRSVISEKNITDPQTLKEKITGAVESGSQSFFAKLKQSLENGVSDTLSNSLADKIKNSTQSFLAGYKQAKEESFEKKRTTKPI